jgi:hypothetical protein
MNAADRATIFDCAKSHDHDQNSAAAVHGDVTIRRHRPRCAAAEGSRALGA